MVNIVVRPGSLHPPAFARKAITAQLRHILPPAIRGTYGEIVMVVTILFVLIRYLASLVPQLIRKLHAQQGTTVLREPSDQSRVR